MISTAPKFFGSPFQSGFRDYFRTVSPQKAMRLPDLFQRVPMPTRKRVQTTAILYEN